MAAASCCGSSTRGSSRFLQGSGGSSWGVLHARVKPVTQSSPTGAARGTTRLYDFFLFGEDGSVICQIDGYKNVIVAEQPAGAARG